MAARDWFRPARHLAAVFVLLAIVPSLLLTAFGWRLLQQDRALEAQQARVAREQAADVIAAAFEQQIAAAETALRAGGATRAVDLADAASVAFATDGPIVDAQAPLLFVPAPESPVPAEPLFEAAERLEFVEANAAAAEAAYRRATGGLDPAVRAGALIRLARVLRRRQSNEAALAAYAQAASIDGVRAGGVPADLLARWARCDLLEKLGRVSELHSESALLVDDLLAARWTLSRGQFETHFGDALRWSGRGDAPSKARDRLGLAHAVDALYDRWQQRTPSAPFAGRAAVSRDGVRHVLIWQEREGRASGLAAGERFVRDQWLSKIAPLAARHGMRVALAESGPPLALIVEPIDSRVPGLFAGRRAIWLAGLACVLLVIGSGTYVVGRAVSRELAVARVQSDFVAAVSHEFRTPLTSLRQLTELLIDRPPEPARARQYYDTLARQTERLHRLVENLLDFGRMEAGTSPYRFEPVDVGAFVADIARQFEADPAAREHRVVFQGDGNAGCVLADRDALGRALWNLLDNAAKYSPGTAQIWIDLVRDQAAVLVHVRDAGMGIPLAEQPEIFATFVRGATAKAENIGGTGIGLAMVRHIAVAHGGSVEVASAQGSGSTFTLKLPAAATEPAPGKETAWLES